MHRASYSKALRILIASSPCFSGWACVYKCWAIALLQRMPCPALRCTRFHWQHDMPSKVCSCFRVCQGMPALQPELQVLLAPGLLSSRQ